MIFFKERKNIKTNIFTKKNSGIKSSTEYQKESLELKIEKLQKITKRTKGEM